MGGVIRGHRHVDDHEPNPPGLEILVELEESVYLAADPRRSSQIVLTSDGEAETVQWAISRVVAGGVAEEG